MKIQKLNCKFCLHQIFPLQKKKKKLSSRSKIFHAKQTKGIVESLGLLSKLATHQLRKQINLRFHFLSLHAIDNIHQIRVNNHIKSFNPINLTNFGALPTTRIIRS